MATLVASNNNIPSTNISTTKQTTTNNNNIPPYRPHQDPTLTFDFEPAIEEDAITIEAKRTRQKRLQDPRYKTVVCMHWISGLCMKQEKCEFLHEFDPERMPDCKNNERCTDKMCYFKHLRADERALCNNYRFGFCPHGSTCKYQHRKKNADELPEVSEYVAPSYSSSENKDDSNFIQQSFIQQSFSTSNNTSTTSTTTHINPQISSRNNPQLRNPNYRTAMCNSIQNGGSCQYGDTCNYAHTKEEMEEHIRFRAAMIGPDGASSSTGLINPMNILDNNTLNITNNTNNPTTNNPQASNNNNPNIKKVTVYPLDRIVADLRNWGDEFSGIDYLRIDSQYKDKPLQLYAPGMPPTQFGKCRFFICRAENFTNLFASLKFSAWVVHPSLGPVFNAAFQEVEHVYLIFAVDPDGGDDASFAGLARMRSEFQVVADERVEPSTSGEIPLTCKVEWLRACELIAKKTAYLTSVVPIVARELPVYMCIEGAEIPPSIGRALVSMLYLEPNNAPSKEALEEETNLHLVAHNLGPWQSLNSAFEASPLPPPEIGPINIPSQNIQVGQYAVRVKKQGYVLHVASPAAFTEMMQRSMLGAPLEEKTDLDSCITPGTVMLVYSTFDGKVHGVFEALSYPELLWEPSAFKNQELPLHIKFRSLIICGQIHENAFTPFKKEKGIISSYDLQQLVNFMAFRARKPQFKPQSPLRSEALELLYEGGTLPIEYPAGIHWNDAVLLGNGLWRQTCTINIQFNPKFKAPHKLIGKGGIHMKEIKEQSGATQARVMAGEEEPAPGIIEMIFEGPSKDSINLAHKFGSEKLDELMHEWENYLETGRQMARTRALAMMSAGVMASGGVEGYYNSNLDASLLVGGSNVGVFGDGQQPPQPPQPQQPQQPQQQQPPQQQPRPFASPSIGGCQQQQQQQQPPFNERNTSGGPPPPRGQFHQPPGMNQRYRGPPSQSQLNNNDNNISNNNTQPSQQPPRGNINITPTNNNGPRGPSPFQPRGPITGGGYPSQHHAPPNRTITGGDQKRARSQDRVPPLKSNNNLQQQQQQSSSSQPPRSNSQQPQQPPQQSRSSSSNQQPSPTSNAPSRYNSQQQSSSGPLPQRSQQQQPHSRSNSQQPPRSNSQQQQQQPQKQGGYRR